MRKVTRANELFSTINYKQAEIELCDCGEDAVGTNIHGRPACKFHSSPNEPFKPIEVLPEWVITPKDAQYLAKKHSVKTSMNLNQRYANDKSKYSKSPIGSYEFAIHAGATHMEVRDARARGLHLDDYAYARSSGASHKEVLYARSRGVDVGDYGFARRSGASHEQVGDAHERGVDVVDYVRARNRGAGHEQMMDAHECGLNVVDYARARHAGSSHEETLDAHARDVDLYDYTDARISGASHEETLDAHARGVNVVDYAYARRARAGHENAGSSHEQVMAAHALGVDLDDYARARHAGSSHEQVLDAHERGVKLAHARYANESPSPWPESIEELINHMSIYHHGQIKDIVTHFTNMVDELGDVVPKGKRTTLINELIKAQLTTAVETGAIKPTQSLAEHEYLHGGRADGPDRGHDFIPVKGPKEEQRLRALIDHEHTTIPDSKDW